MSLDKQRKKELAAAYTQSFRPMGIYEIRNTDNGKRFVDASMDLDGARNRLQFMSQMGQSPIPELRADWKPDRRDWFVFEVLDELKPHEESSTDAAELAKYRDELDALLEMWLEKLQPYGERGYNKPKRR